MLICLVCIALKLKTEKKNITKIASYPQWVDYIKCNYEQLTAKRASKKYNDKLHDVCETAIGKLQKQSHFCVYICPFTTILHRQKDGGCRVLTVPCKPNTGHYAQRKQHICNIYPRC